MLIAFRADLVRALGEEEFVRRFGALDYMMVLSTDANETCQMANQVWPIAAYPEIDGSFTNFQGRVQRIQRRIPAAGKRDRRHRGNRAPGPRARRHRSPAHGGRRLHRDGFRRARLQGPEPRNPRRARRRSRVELKIPPPFCSSRIRMAAAASENTSPVTLRERWPAASRPVGEGAANRAKSVECRDIVLCHSERSEESRSNPCIVTLLTLSGTGFSLWSSAWICMGQKITG